MFMHFEVLRIMLKKVISEHLSRVKNSEDSLKPICMLKNASLKVLGFGKVQDNKALHKRYINGYKEIIQHSNEAISESITQ